MMPLFEAHNIRVFALSKDTPAQAQLHKERDELTHITLLSDASMTVIRAFGLEHHKAIEFVTWNLFGIPLGVPSGYKTMAIPTTLLIDEKGIVQWIDQADDYRQRGDEARVREAIIQAFS